MKIKRELGKQGWTHQVEQITKEQKVKELGAQACPILRDSLNCSPPGSSVRGILQARILEWVVIPFSKASSPPRDGTQVSYRAGILYCLSHQEALCSQRSRRGRQVPERRESEGENLQSLEWWSERYLPIGNFDQTHPCFSLWPPYLVLLLLEEKADYSRKGLPFRRESSCPYLVCSYPESVLKGTWGVPTSSTGYKALQRPYIQTYMHIYTHTHTRMCAHTHIHMHTQTEAHVSKHRFICFKS